MRSRMPCDVLNNRGLQQLVVCIPEIDYACFSSAGCCNCQLTIASMRWSKNEE